jgi:hypothetical protein
MDRYLKAQDLLVMFERGPNPLPDVKQDTALLVRLTGANSRLLEAYFKLYGIRVDRQELRLFADGTDQVYVLTWPGPLFRDHWAQRLAATGRRKRK